MDSNIEPVRHRASPELRSGSHGRYERGVDGLELLGRRADDDEGDGVLPWLTALQADAMVSRVRRGGLMRMSGDPVLVLRVIVVAVAVHVQSGDTPPRGEKGDSEKDRGQPAHKASVCNAGGVVK